MCSVSHPPENTSAFAEPESQWRQWCELYERVSAKTRGRTRIVRVDNDGLIEGAVRRQLALSLSEARTDTPDKADIQLPLDLQPSALQESRPCRVEWSFSGEANGGL